MSLQVWLPLTKDLRQQGLSDVTVTNNGATYESSGKLGGCYNLTNGPINITNLPNSTSISVAFWFKRTANTNTRQFMFTAWNGVTCELTTDGKPTFAVYRNSYPTITGPTAITTSTGWIHYCGTFSPTEGMKMYLNGELVASNTNTTAISWSTTTGQIGKYGSYASMSAQMNDFRLYDHALSQMEVKELAKGLVLHYPLNRQGWGQDNLLAHYVVPGQGAPTSTASGGRTTWLGDYAITIPATENADTYFRLFMTEQLVSGQIYTISCQASGLIPGTYYNFPMFAQNNSSMGYLSINHNGLCTMTFTMTWTGTQTAATGANGETVYVNFLDDITRTIATGQGPITLTHFKLEKGSIATPWCPNSTDILATTMGLNSTAEYDCSGLCNNGTRTGIFTWTSDTPKYNVSQVFASGNNYIDCGASQEILPTDGLTVSLWTNYSTWGNPISCTEGGGWNFENSSGIQFPVYVAGVGYKVANSGVATSTLQNGWHMLTGTFDKTNVKIYIDGVLKATTTTGSTNGIGYAANHCYVGAEAAGSTSIASAALVGKLSDVRIYATALSADDVKSLYQNSAYIDSSGNVYGAVHTEV